MAAERLEEVEKTVLHHPDPVVSASDVAEELDEERRDVLEDLRVLQRAGDVDRKKVGARAVAWWHTERVLPAPARDPADHPDQTALEETAETVANDERRDETTPGPNWIIDHLDLPGRGEKLERRREAVRACYEHIREHGEGQRSEFIENFYESHQAGFGSERGWWNAIGKKGLQQLAEEVDELEPPAGEGSHKWTWAE